MSDETKVLNEDEVAKAIEAMKSGAAETKPADEAGATGLTVEAVSDHIRKTVGLDSQKAVEDNKAMSEVVAAMGSYIEKSQKATLEVVNNQAEQTLALTKNIQTLAKSVEGLTEKVTAMGSTDQPTKSALSDVVQKSADKEDAEKASAEANPATDVAKALANPTELTDEQRQSAKQEVMTGLETLVKSTKDEQERAQLLRATIGFEATGKIDKSILQRAINVLTPKAA